MIFYFSGTGNSAWVARTLADLTGDTAYDLISYRQSPDITERTVGFVFPVYAWGLPAPVTAFVKRLSGEAAFTFALCTCGSEAGYALNRLNRLIRLDSRYSLSMPNNYILGSGCAESDDVIHDKITRAQQTLPVIAQEILAKLPTVRVDVGKMPRLKSTLIHAGFSKFACTTKPFYATDLCNGCGLCAERCPAQTIRLQDGKPIWGKTCYQCTACLNNCPQGAIEYGKSTIGKKRYHFPNL